MVRERRFTIDLPQLPAGRELGSAFLVIPDTFPLACASVCVSRNLVLHVPHVDSNGKVCFAGDIGPSSGLSPEERIDATLYRFVTEFVIPWGEGKLDKDFEAEPRTYWSIHVIRNSSAADAVNEVYTVHRRPEVACVYEAPLVSPARWLLAAEDSQFNERLIAALGPRASQLSKVVVARIPIEYDLTPLTWPRTVEAMELLLGANLSDAGRRKFETTSGARRRHRIVILSSQKCDYGYLMPGGPPTAGKTRRGSRPIPVTGLLPLSVSRIDPGWTYGRDQHPLVLKRQDHHVVVFGAGALGGHVIDQLARAGVGRISLVDPDFMESANIGRHLLGMESLGSSKAEQVAQRVGRSNPACVLRPYKSTAQGWLLGHALDGIHMIVDLTGEPTVRIAIESARALRPTPLIVGWMEPFVAAAHVCQLMAGVLWLGGKDDRMGALQAVTWPPEVMRHEPACNSEFQAYTSAAAVFAVALVAESALELLDGQQRAPRTKSWVRGYSYLNAQYAGLALRDWAAKAGEFDGVLIERAWDE